jgi:hypothetical protein
MKKGTIPAGADFCQELDEYFEQLAIKDLDENRIADWGIWIGLRQCYPSTASRIICHALRLCSKRGDGPPAQLVCEIERQLEISAVPRARQRNPGLIAEVVQYLIRNPRSTHREIAKALGQPNKQSAIYRLFDRAEFWAECAEQSLRYDTERAHQVLKQYVVRFGQTFEYGTARASFAALSSLVPFMIDALDGVAPPLTDGKVRDIAADQRSIRSEEALKRRFRPVSQ